MPDVYLLASLHKKDKWDESY